MVAGNHLAQSFWRGFRHPVGPEDMGRCYRRWQLALTAVTQGWLIRFRGPLWPLGRQEHEGIGMQHLQIHTFGPKGASSTEKMIDQALQPSAKKRHREGTVWPAGVPSGFRRVKAIWLGELGATWKGDRQEVRI